MSHNHKPFAHLHVHSEFSLLDGLSRINHLTERAIELNMPALALTDHGTMYGTIQFYRACIKAGIKPILGVEGYLAARRMQDRNYEFDRERYHILLLAENQTGYLNLLQIVSAAQLDGFYYRPRTDREYLEAHSDGLITTTGCMAGEIPRAIQAGNLEKAKQLMSWYVDVFGRERFFVELQEHSIPELQKINKILLELADQFNLRCVATNDVHYTTASEANPHDVLLCIQTGKTVDASQRMRMSDQGYYLKSYAEMEKMFGHIPGALDNSLLIAEMCNVNPEPAGYHLPKFEVPSGLTPESYLHQLCESGLIWRYGQERSKADPVLKERLDYELGIIHTMGFDAYFLIVWDLCQFARQEDIWWNVRGSGAGSLVAFTLGITGIDPLAIGLIFERFLNPGRVSMPDIDLDYPDDRRHEMIEYTIRKYGSDKVAQIITFGTMGARAAIRDVGRALDVPLPEVDDIAKLIPAIPGKPVSIQDVLNPDHEFHSDDLIERYKRETKIKSLVDTAQSLEGVARHASTHAAGVIISDIPLVKYTPLHRPTSGNGDGEGIGVVTQWPMEILDSIGLLKVDFLGLSTLTILRRAAELIESRTGIVYTMENIPYDVGHVGPDPDKKPERLFEMLGRGEVAGVFQVEGAGMRRLMLQMKPQRFDNIIAAISLYRPGPMENIPEYIARMHGKKKVTYHHDDLEPILRDTYGIVVYQEQIIRIAADLAGYAPGEADLLRKAVAKKKRDLMDMHRSQFIAGAVARGIPEDASEAIWGDIEFFARYGFNKAHAADYAVITCQTAFLKAHYPVEYMTALLSVERNNTDKVAHYLAETRRMGIVVAPPAINRSDLDFSIEGDESQPIIRYGLGAIKNSGAAAIRLMLDEQQQNGPFKDLPDLCDRVDLRKVGKRALESMIKVGVFDSWGSRSQLLSSLDRIVGHSGRTHEAAEAGQMSLFGGQLASSIDVDIELLSPATVMAEEDHREVLQWEKELIGVYISEHPVSRPAELLKDMLTATTGDLDETYNGRPVTILGLLSSLRRFVTKKGDPMAFGALEDLQGSIEVVFFPRTWKQFRDIVEVDQIYIVRGKIRVENDERIKILADSIENTLNIAQSADEPTEQIAQTQNGVQSENKKSVQDISEIPGEEPEFEPWEAPQEKSPKVYQKKSAIHADKEFNVIRDDRPPPPANFPSDELAPMKAAAEFPEQKKEIEVPPTSEPQPDLARAGQISSFSDPATPPIIQSPTERVAQTAIPAQVFEVKNASKLRRTLIVEVRPVRAWQETCRQLVDIASDYDGHDGLRIKLSGSGLVMEFPNQNTHYCLELEQAIGRLPAIAHVEVA